ncbi:MAG: maleylpyruvate isomerase family mycothiol-dependent enzyme [Actinomycetota bacterium]
MTLDRQWLLATTRAEREALGRTIQYTPPAAWEQDSPSPGWRMRDIVAHLAAGEVAAAAAIAGEASTEVEEYLKGLEGEPATLEGFNQFSVRRRADVAFRQVVTEWGKAADLFLSRASKISPEEWTSLKVQWMAGPIGVSYLVQSRVMEWWLHGQDILAGGGNPPRLEHPPIYCVNDLAVRTIPYALSLAGLSFPGKSVKVELEAVGGGSWHWGLAPRETPAPNKPPNAVITGRAYAFALVAGRRIPAEYYLAEGGLQTAGDDALAETILQHLRAFAA